MRRCDASAVIRPYFFRIVLFVYPRSVRDHSQICPPRREKGYRGIIKAAQQYAVGERRMFRRADFTRYGGAAFLFREDTALGRLPAAQRIFRALFVEDAFRIADNGGSLGI